MANRWSDAEPPAAPVLPAGDAGAVRSWAFPEVRGGAPAPATPDDRSEPPATGPALRMPTAQDIEAIEEAAHAEGYARGEAEGRAAGRAAGAAELQQRLNELEALMQRLARPLERLDEEIEQQLGQLVIAVARQLIRRELRSDPGEVMAAVREALGVLPVGARDVEVHLHPQDAEFIRDKLGLDQDAAWRLIEDPTLDRGGCQVISHSSRIDASVEGRLAAVAAAVFGGIRSEDIEGEGGGEA